MTTTAIDEHKQQTAEWLHTIYQQYEWEGIVHEVNAVLSEARQDRGQAARYRQTLWNTAVMLEQLFEANGNEQLLDASRDIKRLMQWSETGTPPIQLDLFPANSVEVIT